MPDRKEIHFFSNPDRFALGEGWYRSHFAAAGAALAIGEASTNYTKYPRRSGTPARIAELIPAARLVYVVRDPIERIRSHYVHLVHGHGERRPLEEVVRDVPELIDLSRYSTQLDQYLPFFDQSQIHLVIAERLRRERAATLAQVFEFLGVDAALAPPPGGDAHRSDAKRVDTAFASRARARRPYLVVRRAIPRPARRIARRLVTRPVAQVADTRISADLREELVSTLAPEVAGLRRFLGDDFDGWGMG